MPQIDHNIRWQSRAQIERIKKAAKLRKWSFNQFVTEAAQDEATRLLRQNQAPIKGDKTDDDPPSA